MVKEESWKRLQIKYYPFIIEKKTQYLLSLCIFIMLFGLGCLHATKGLDLTDEGMYLSTAMRYSLGDVPFRDEIMNNMRPFDVLVSPVFMIYPNISLFQIRCIGLILTLATYFTLFLFMVRYAPPFFVALTCAVMFLSNNFHGILSPSYNMLSSDFSLIAMISWLFAITSNKRHYCIWFSVIGGLFLSLAVLSYLSIVIIICLPMAFAIIIVRYPFERRNTYLHSSILFIGSFVMIITTVVIIFIYFGILSDFIWGFWEGARTTALQINGPLSKIYRLVIEFSHVSLYGVILLGNLFFVLFIIPKERRKNDFIYGVIAIIIEISLFAMVFYYSAHLPFKLIVISFALPLALFILFFNHEHASNSSVDTSWKIVRNMSIAWGVFLSLIYGVSSGTILNASVHGSTPLFVVGFIALYRSVGHYASLREPESIRTIIWPAIITTAVVIFLIGGANFYHNSVYRGEDVTKLTEPFRHPRLKGIYSTSEKVRVIEDLLEYLKGKVKPGDYFLAYNYIPMLYFLTSTRPAYGATWARDDWPISLRKQLLKKMLDNNRIPEYCVRMLTFPDGPVWKRRMFYDKYSPLDSFVQTNYYVEKIIFPFIICRRIH